MMGRNEIKVYCTNLYFKAHKKAIPSDLQQ